MEIMMNKIALAISTKPEMYLFDGALVEFLLSGEQTNGAFALLRATLPPGTLTIAHYHKNEEETPYILEGVLQVETQGRTIALSPGETMTMPRNVPHRLGNVTSAATRVLLLSSPDGFGNFVREVGERVEDPETQPAAMTGARSARLKEAALRYGIITVDEAALKSGLIT
jgi:quercetin dioxygenase-like cupin family protein